MTALTQSDRESELVHMMERLDLKFPVKRRYRRYKVDEPRSLFGAHSEQDVKSTTRRRDPLFSQQEPFRFLDMPAELRINVYEIAFAAGRPRPQLLRTCRQIYNEAQKIFEAESCACFSVHYFRRSTDGGQRPQATGWEVTSIGHLSHNQSNPPSNDSLGHAGAIVSGLRILKNVQKLSLRFSLVDRDPRRLCLDPQCFFFALVLVCTKLKTVDVDVGMCDTGTHHEGYMLGILEPLQGLPIDCTLTLRNMGETIEKTFWQSFAEARVQQSQV